MTSIPLFLSSASSTGAYNKSADGSQFSIDFVPAIQIPAGKHVSIRVIEANVWYNTINISAALANNKFYYTNDLADSDKYSVTVPDGIYGLSELNSAVDLGVQANGHASGLMSLIAEDATQKVLLKIDNSGYQVDFQTAGTFRDIIGFDSQLIPASALTTASLTTRANNVANFSDLEMILLHSNLGGTAILNGKSSTVCATITPDVGVGSLITSRPRHPLVVETPNIGTYIDNATFWLTDQLNTRFNTNSEDWSFRMIIDVR